jgi:MFS family permease
VSGPPRAGASDATGRNRSAGGPSRRSPLRDSDFARLWAGGLISDLGDWTLLIGLPVFVFQLTGSALTTSTVFVVETVPALLVGQVAGVLVDRLDRRRIVVLGSLLQALALLPLLAVTTADLIWVVYLVAAVESVLARLVGPATLALVPSLVPSERLPAANGLSGVSQNLARLVGSPAGGLMVQLFGLGGVVVVDALTFMVAALLIGWVRVRPAGASEGATAPATGGLPRALVADWVDGLRTIARAPRLRSTLAISAASQVAQGIFVVLFVVFVLDELRADGGAVGLIRGVQAIGGILGGLAVSLVRGRAGPQAMVGWGFVAFGLISLATWNLPVLTTAVPVYAALFVLVGIPGIGTSTGLLTLLQTLTPPTHLGRVFAAFEAGAGALQAVGVLVAGALADRTGVLPILDVQASIYVLCGVAALVLLREGPATPSRRAARRRSEPTDGPADGGVGASARRPWGNVRERRTQPQRMQGAGEEWSERGSPVRGTLRRVRAHRP